MAPLPQAEARSVAKPWTHPLLAGYTQTPPPRLAATEEMLTMLADGDLCQVCEGGAADQHRAGQVDPQRLLPGLEARLEPRLDASGDGRVVHGDVEPSGRRGQLLDHGPDRVSSATS